MTAIISDNSIALNKEMETYKKLCNTLTSFLKGKGYHRALDAFYYAQENHPGFRKDNITPNFKHQVDIVLFLMTLKEIKHEEDTFIAAFLHDIREDAGIENSVIESRYGKRVAKAVEKLTKEFKGVKKDTLVYFKEIATCPIASLVKLADRINNVSTMVGVFTIPKQDDYVFEIKKYFLPLLKASRKHHPYQHLSYHGMGTFLKNMCKTVEAVLVAEKETIKLREKIALYEKIHGLLPEPIEVMCDSYDDKKKSKIKV